MTESETALLVSVKVTHFLMAGRVARSEACPLGMQAASSSIPTSGTFFHGDEHEKFLQPFTLFPADSRRAVVSYWQKNVH